MSFIAVLFACAPGTIVLGTPDATSDTGNVAGDDTGEAVDEGSAYAGDYVGEISWWMQDWDWTICDDGDADFVIADDGSFGGSGTCVYYGQQDDYDMEWELAGSVDEDGEISGEVSWETWAIYNNYELEAITSDLWGSVEDGDFDVEFEADSFMGDYGDYPVSGEIRAELD